MLVSGVRSSCEASATNWRWRASVSSRLVARRLEAVEHVLERARQLGDLVVGRGLGERRAGVAGARDVARAGGERGDRRHRAAADDQPAEEGEERAAEDADGEEQPDALDGGLDDRGLAAVLDDDRHDERPLRVLDRHVADARLDAVAAGLRGAAEEDAEVRRALGLVEHPPVALQRRG